MGPIVVITEPKYSVFLLSIIESANPQAEVHFIFTRHELVSFFAESPQVTRLIAFCTSVIVPPRILGELGGPAYNFHSGPPTHPGRYAAPFALYEGTKRFGATAHVMHAKVDAGPIVGVAEFDVPEDVDLDWLAARTLKAALKLFIHLCPALVRSTAPLPLQPIAWSGTPSTTKALERCMDLPVDISQEELERRRRAFRIPGRSLTVTLHGHRFCLLEQQWRPSGVCEPGAGGVA